MKAWLNPPWGGVLVGGLGVVCWGFGVEGLGEVESARMGGNGNVVVVGVER
jgi:hypothetical protein